VDPVASLFFGTDDHILGSLKALVLDLLQCGLCIECAVNAALESIVWEGFVVEDVSNS